MRIRLKPCLCWAVALGAVGLAVGFALFRQFRSEAEQRELILLRMACENLQRGSDHLTEHVRRFVESDGREADRDAYFKEVWNDSLRDKAMRLIATLKRRDPAVRSLNEAMELSLSLMLKEYHAMRLLTREERVPFAPQELREFRLTDEECVLTWDERRARAREEVFGDVYAAYKNGIGHRIAEVLAYARSEDCR